MGKYVGVTFNSKRGKYQAYVGLNNKKVYLNQFDSEMDAAIYRELYLLEHPENKSRRNNVDVSSTTLKLADFHRSNTSIVRSKQIKRNKVVLTNTEEGFAVLENESQGVKFKISLCDLDRVLNACCWFEGSGSTAGRIVGHIRSLKETRHGLVFLSRFILDFPFGVIDHLDRNPLNNTRENLEVVSSADNMANIDKSKSASKFIGVRKLRNKWAAITDIRQTDSSRKVTYLGSFDSELEAAIYYDAYIWQRTFDRVRTNLYLNLYTVEDLKSLGFSSLDDVNVTIPSDNPAERSSNYKGVTFDKSKGKFFCFYSYKGKVKKLFYDDDQYVCALYRERFLQEYRFLNNVPNFLPILEVKKVTLLEKHLGLYKEEQEAYSKGLMFLGVTKLSNGKFRAESYTFQHKKILGDFNTGLEAALFREKFILSNPLVKARLNFLDKDLVDKVVLPEDLILTKGGFKISNFVVIPPMTRLTPQNKLMFFKFEVINKQSIITSMLNVNKGHVKNRVFARKCKIISITGREAFAFYEENHILGGIYPQETKALVYNDKVVAAMSFNGELLNRFASLLNTVVVGGFTKLLKAFNKSYVETFLDKRTSLGVSVYERCGFTKVGDTTPNYYYVHPSEPTKAYFRRSFQKSKIQKYYEQGTHNITFYDPNLTEKENMKKNGYIWYFDLGQTKFVLGNKSNK